MTIPGNAEVVMNQNAVGQPGSGAGAHGFSGSLPSGAPPSGGPAPVPASSSPSPSKMRNGRFERWHLAPETVPEEDGWFLTYLDVITLMLVMMVVMLSFAGPGQQGPASSTERKAAPSALPSSPVPFVGGPGMPSPIPLPVPTAPADPEIQADLLAGLALDPLDKNIEVIVNKGTISFRISSEVLFNSGESNLSEAGRAVMSRLVPTLGRVPGHRVVVEGHTDNVPIQTDRFPSNWELSTGRAASVVRHLQGQGIDAARMRATGYADTRPIASNATAQGRATNRHVEVILEASK